MALLIILGHIAWLRCVPVQPGRVDSLLAIPLPLLVPLPPPLPMPLPLPLPIPLPLLLLLHIKGFAAAFAFWRVSSPAAACAPFATPSAEGLATKAGKDLCICMSRAPAAATAAAVAVASYCCCCCCCRLLSFVWFSVSASASATCPDQQHGLRIAAPTPLSPHSPLCSPLALLQPDSFLAQTEHGQRLWQLASAAA